MPDDFFDTYPENDRDFFQKLTIFVAYNTIYIPQVRRRIARRRHRKCCIFENDLNAAF